MFESAEHAPALVPLGRSVPAGAEQSEVLCSRSKTYREQGRWLRLGMITSTLFIVAQCAGARASFTQGANLNMTVAGQQE